tara:strand:- start:263 stop:571 length:309 start_codon:yes stop_codon:yes gene_type:complete
MKYKVVIDVEVDEKEAELWFWSCAIEYLAEEVRDGDEKAQDKPGFKPFKEIQEGYEGCMIDNLKDDLYDFFNNAGMKNRKTHLHRMDRNTYVKSYKIYTENE